MATGILMLNMVIAPKTSLASAGCTTSTPTSGSALGGDGHGLVPDVDAATLVHGAIHLEGLACSAQIHEGRGQAVTGTIT